MAEEKRKVPIKMKDFSVLDTEFDSIRDRFDREMSKMEEEMNKFRTELLDKESSFFTRNSSGFGNNLSTSQRRVQSARTSSRRVVNGKEVVNENSEFQSDSLVAGGLGNHRNWLQGLDSPLIHPNEEEDGQKELKLRFDVSQYSPDEIVVKTVDNKLMVHAKHEEQTGGKTVYREYNREFLLPSGTDAEAIRSSLSKDGILTVEAPLPQPALTHKK